MSATFPTNKQSVFSNPPAQYSYKSELVTTLADNSAIEWTEATWNPVTGCEEVSPGCAHCYAETFAERWRGIPGHPYEQGFALKLWPGRLEQPLKWARPR